MCWRDIANVVRGLRVWYVRGKRQGGAGARKAIDAPTMPRLGDAGGRGRMRAGGALNISKDHTTFSRARGALVKRVGVRVWGCAVNCTAPAWALRHPVKCTEPLQEL